MTACDLQHWSDDTLLTIDCSEANLLHSNRTWCFKLFHLGMVFCQLCGTPKYFADNRHQSSFGPGVTLARCHVASLFPTASSNGISKLLVLGTIAHHLSTWQWKILLALAWDSFRHSYPSCCFTSPLLMTLGYSKIAGT